MAIELRAYARYRLVDCPVIAEHIGMEWWMLQSAATLTGELMTWAISPDGKIYQGAIEMLQHTNPPTFRPLGPETDLCAEDLVFVCDGPYGEGGDIEQSNRRILE